MAKTDQMKEFIKVFDQINFIPLYLLIAIAE